MDEFTINEMKEMQLILQEKYKDKWEGISVLAGRNKLIEELADVLMYYNDILLCYDISSEELKTAYKEKFERNMKRW